MQQKIDPIIFVFTAVYVILPITTVENTPGFVKIFFI